MEFFHRLEFKNVTLFQENKAASGGTFDLIIKEGGSFKASTGSCFHFTKEHKSTNWLVNKLHQLSTDQREDQIKMEGKISSGQNPENLSDCLEK